MLVSTHLSLQPIILIIVRMLSPSDSHCDLEVILSSDLSWNKHFDLITAKAYRSLGLLCRSFSNSVSIPVRKILNISLVRSQLTYIYGSQLWHPHLIKRHYHCGASSTVCNLLYDFNSSYKSRLPLMYLLDYYDIMFFVILFRSSTSQNDLPLILTCLII